MRMLSFAILCLFALILAGIVTVTMSSKQNIDVHFDRQKAGQDVRSAIDTGKEWIHKTEEPAGN